VLTNKKLAFAHICTRQKYTYNVCDARCG